jgi:hypothetical protein
MSTVYGYLRVTSPWPTTISASTSQHSSPMVRAVACERPVGCSPGAGRAARAIGSSPWPRNGCPDGTRPAPQAPSRYACVPAVVARCVTEAAAAGAEACAGDLRPAGARSHRGAGRETGQIVHFLYQPPLGPRVREPPADDFDRRGKNFDTPRDKSVTARRAERDHVGGEP